ncbi:MAG: hypothetical protein ABI318_22780, partial [Chthoniobacteraceae bacterium]
MYSATPGTTIHRDTHTASVFGWASSAHERGAPEGGVKNGYEAIRTCIWIYFWLLMLEGALRKWILPGLSNPLLLVKDPVVIISYLIALKYRRFPGGAFVNGTIVLGTLALLVSMVMSNMDLTGRHFLVAMYGFRTDFFYVPFMFLIANTLDWNDVKKFGKWMLIVSLPVAILTFLQFRSSQESIWNVGVGGSVGGQMDAGFDKSRASGIFSFNTGLASYLAMVAAFVIHHFLQGKVYARWLGFASMMALAASTALSASRGITMSVILVCAVGASCVVLQPKLAGRAVWLLVGLLLLGLVFASSRILSEGLFVLSSRFEAGEGFKVGILERTFASFTGLSDILSDQRIFGRGLGVGTNVGAGLLTGKRDFLAGEGEWGRVIAETGPVLGLAFIALRVGITFHLLRRSLASLRKGDSLAMLMFGACALLMLNGQWGTAQVLGFVVFAG